MRKTVIVLGILSAGMLCISCESGSSSCSDVCTPGARHCLQVDDMLVSAECGTGRNGCLDWVPDSVCPAGCAEGQCVKDPQQCVSDCQEVDPDVCISDTRLQTCTKGKDGCFHKAYKPCRACSDGICAEPCQSNCSEAGARTCGERSVLECQEVEPGCLLNKEVEICDKYCKGGECTDCPINCTENEYMCAGKTYRQCVKNETTGCMEWKDVKTCSAHCNAAKGCTEDLPRCRFVPGAQASVRQWTDGDTVWVVAESDGSCNNYEYDKEDQRWKQIRWRIRVHGIDAPECSKARNQYYYYVCKKDDRYTNTNERYGYESWVWADRLLPFRSRVTLSCDKTQGSGECEYDNTADEGAAEDQQVYNRYLAYIGYSRNNASYDFSTEIAREGLAFSNTHFSSSKRGEICAASKEAQDAGKNIWSLGDGSTSSVLRQMSSTKQKGLKNMKRECGLR